MQQNNSVMEFILSGLTQDPKRQKMVFVIFIFYVGTLMGHLLVITTIKFSCTLGSPMYFFLFYLSLVDTCFSTSVAPRLIVDALFAKKSIFYNECLTQVFALYLYGCMEIFVLVLMAMNRYVAICKPLNYATIMSRQVCIILIVLVWIGSFTHSVAQTILALRLPFCGSNLIDHYCCDMQPLLKLACMDIYVMNLLMVINSALCASNFIILMISYIVILHSLWNHSAKERKKPLSTCTSHVIVVVLSFGSCIFIYTQPPTTFPMDKMLEVFYMIGTPFLNPLIYTLRNAEVKNAMRKLWHVRITSESKR
ncbi:LOW QUALITY PROTEIN: olfactory receptor 4C11-like [Dama dama]